MGFLPAKKVQTKVQTKAEESIYGKLPGAGVSPAQPPSAVAPAKLPVSDEAQPPEVITIE